MTEQAQMENTEEVVLYEKIETDELKRLAELYMMTKEHDDSDPLDLQEKMTVYGQIFEIMGDMEAAALGQEKLAYAIRHEVAAQKYLHSKHVRKEGESSLTKLTGDERKAVAEMAVKKYRRNEARFAQESKKWRNRREAVLEQINIMKRRQDLFGDQWDKANFINGYGGK